MSPPVRIERCSANNVRFWNKSFVFYIKYNYNNCTKINVAIMTLQKLIDLGYETLPHTLYSPDILLIEHRFFKQIDNFYATRNYVAKKMLKLAFKDFLTSKHLEFYRKCINKLETRWQKCVYVQGSYYDLIPI